MEDELTEVRDNVVLPMQMWNLFKGEYVRACGVPIFFDFFKILYLLSFPSAQLPTI